MNINFILTILIQVTCIFIFLTVFFFTYAAKEEEKVVTEQINFLVDDAVGSNLNILPNKMKEQILSKVNSIQPGSSTDVNDNIKKNNDSIKKKSTTILITISSIVLLIVGVSVYLSKSKVPFFEDLKLGHILKEVFFIVLFVGLTEFVFLTYFASNWVSIDPNKLKAHIFNNLALGVSSSS